MVFPPSGENEFAPSVDLLMAVAYTSSSFPFRSLPYPFSLSIHDSPLLFFFSFEISYAAVPHVAILFIFVCVSALPPTQQLYPPPQNSLLNICRIDLM